MDLVLDKEFEVLLTGGPQGGGCSEERSGPEIRIQGFLQENGGQAVCREEEGRWLSVTPRPALKAPGRGVSQQRRLRRRPRTAPRHSRDEGENRTKDATCSTMGCVNSFESCQEIRQDASYGTRPVSRNCSRGALPRPLCPRLDSRGQELQRAENSHTLRSASGCAVTPAPFHPAARFQLHLDRSGPGRSGRRHPLPREPTVPGRQT
ncbi:unnamed protein product [Rangifer tarandus platyrhynchus]|uniref:Uncharacterized protein n=2 Tax=Rangifer tarandus platyrhynchus TaxID=3082113 RepID=A0ABN8YEH9_RANTA|nr:unnamed protein product [Rangifer tarandus platyrhynchus]CAI9700252.1 unnamed protein product [Rangifer tarandus platyrhynchus]